MLSGWCVCVSARVSVCVDTRRGFGVRVMVVMVVVGFGAALANVGGGSAAAAVMRFGCLGNGQRISSRLHFNLWEWLSVSRGVRGG